VFTEKKRLTLEESQNCQLKLSQFFYTICAYVVLKILLSRYHYAVVCNKYSQSHPFETDFAKLQTYTVCLEKNCRCFQRPRRVDDFYQQFVWSNQNSRLSSTNLQSKLKQSLSHVENFLYFIYELGFSVTVVILVPR
jgi:nitrate reductase gamma subunit